MSWSILAIISSNELALSSKEETDIFEAGRAARHCLGAVNAGEAVLGIRGAAGRGKSV